MRGGVEAEEEEFAPMTSVEAVCSTELGGGMSPGKASVVRVGAGWTSGGGTPGARVAASDSAGGPCAGFPRGELCTGATIRGG